MNKLYNRQTWHNNTTPALNETNLNILSKAVDDIDDRVIEIAGDVLVVVPEILEKYADIEALATNPPYIGQNGNWWTWDTDLNQYVDSGVDAGVSVTVGTTSTLPAGSSATVTNSGTDTDPILNFGIPQGVAGQDGADGQDGISPEVTITTITGGHRITITDADYPSGQSFDVMDGIDGGVTSFNGRTGIVTPQSGDYTASDVGAVASNGGEAGDTIVTFTDPSADGNITSGSALKTIIGLIKYKLSHITGGGHTILNSSGAAMTQRAKLQFDGLNVSDDSGNDKTVVTAPTPDYVDEQFNPSTTYSLGMTCIEGNVRYRYKNSTATSGHRPPDTTYWEVLSVASELQAIGNKLILPHLFYRGYSNTAMGSMTGISGHSGKSLSVVDDYLTGGNAGNAWYGTYFSNPVNLSDCNRIYVEIENTAIIDSSTSAMYQLILFNTTPVWNGGYVSAVIMDRQGDSYAINYSQGTHICCKDLSSFSASQKANTYVGIGFFGNTTNSHIKQIWVA